jgi:hypothetical protein
MQYPTGPEFNSIYRFGKRFWIQYLPFKHLYVASDTKEKGVSYEFQTENSIMVKVHEFMSTRQETPLTDRKITIRDELDFAWKLYCILRKQGKV